MLARSLSSYGEGPPSPYIEESRSRRRWCAWSRYGEGPPSPYIEDTVAAYGDEYTVTYGEGPPSPYIEDRSAGGRCPRLHDTERVPPLPTLKAFKNPRDNLSRDARVITKYTT